MWSQYRFGVYAKSPAGRGCGVSYCGGSPAPTIKGCGVDAIVLIGAARELRFLISAALPAADPVQFLKGYRRIVRADYEQNPLAALHSPKRRSRRKQSKARNLLDRFRDHTVEIPAFMRDFAVPFDNIGALCSGYHNPQDSRENLTEYFRDEIAA